MAIYLTELAPGNFDFPSPYSALKEPNGLLAFGGISIPNGFTKATKAAFFLGMVLMSLFYGGALRHALCLILRPSFRQKV